jgi:hypothetical protein
MTTTTEAPHEAAPLLRTLSPALRGLERRLRGWLDGPHRHQLPTLRRAALEGMADDLRRQAEALDVDRPLLVIMLMGGTGVGKSTLLNALAGGTIAQASVTRPTTRDPVVYYHSSVRTDRLDPALRHCRLAPHDRPALEYKVLVDTPDLDSNDLANRDKLVSLLPVADVVLYVGSQEKYHDELGWKLFLEHRKRRAFAFVLNKWDRCTHNLESGLRPDEDLLRDLKGQGFENPLLFRTCAQLWVERTALRAPNASPGSDAAPVALPEPPQGEQFQDLSTWIEAGLTRLEIEAIKARGVNQLLVHLGQALEKASPPDLSEAAERTRIAWAKPLTEEAATTTDVLLQSLEPYQREIEHHFALEGQRRFRGIMASYLGLFTKFRYFGSTLRDRIPYLPKSRGEKEPPRWDLSMFTYVCSDVAGNRMLDSRGKALANRLLVEADTQGFPLSLLSEPVEAVARVDWRQRYAQILSEVLRDVERQWTNPTGTRRVIQGVLVFLADWLPIMALLASFGVLLWRFFNPQGEGYNWSTISFGSVLVPFAVLLAVLVILHLLIALLLPMRWPAIRDEFKRRLGERLRDELETTYAVVPGELARALLEERKQVEKLVGETKEVGHWLEEREQAASISGLYGN